MAMLAEPRRKAKYHLQPYTSLSKSNKRCDGDTSSFGYKLMASMGWAPGKGLGANESGKVDPIKLRLKTDAAGMGFKVSEHDALSQQSEFQALLQQLNGSATDGDNLSNKASRNSGKSIKSLEKQSEQSSVRVHYKKFTRGKDLSRASDKDLRSILGLNLSEAPVKRVKVKAVEPVAKEVTVGPQGEMYISAGSSVDYFKDKFGKFKNKKKRKASEDAVTGFDNNGFNDSNTVNKRRSVTWGDVDVSYVENYIKDMVDTSGSVNELDSSLCVDEPSVKKKKKMKRKEVVTEDHEESVEQYEVETSTCEGKKKKQKKDGDERCRDNVSDIQDINICVPKKKKKRKMWETGQDLSQVEENGIGGNTVVCDEKNVLDANTEPLVKLKKKKKKNQNVGEP